MYQLNGILGQCPWIGGWLWMMKWEGWKESDRGVSNVIPEFYGGAEKKHDKSPGRESNSRPADYGLVFPVLLNVCVIQSHSSIWSEFPFLWFSHLQAWKWLLLQADHEILRERHPAIDIKDSNICQFISVSMLSTNETISMTVILFHSLRICRSCPDRNVMISWRVAPRVIN
jgi:hypothetical protein